MQVPDNAYAVILAGGGGTRLWPKSRQKTPKHLLSLFGKETMLQLTYKRMSSIIPKDRVFIITHNDHVQKAKQQLPQVPENNWILEPIARNTALAMGAAAAYIKKIDPSALIINSPADHIINDAEAFEKAVLAALESATMGNYIVAVGIRPTFPHTGLGYIRVGDQIGRVKVNNKDVFVFKSKGFKEKPDQATAQSFIASGQYLWNANYYCWSVETIFNAFAQNSPSHFKNINDLYDAYGTKDEKALIEKVYQKAEAAQIDYAVSEKADNIIVIPGNFDWSDVGDWKVVYDMEANRGKGNVIIPEDSEVIDIDNKDCLIEANGRLIVTIGLKDIVVVDTEDATLICAKDRTQDVKKAVEKLKELKKDKYL